MTQELDNPSGHGAGRGEGGKPPRFVDLARAVLSLQGSGRRSDALEALAQAEAIVPDGPDGAFVIGGLNESLKFWRKAAGWYEKVLSARPEEARGWHRLGIARLHLDDLPGAAEALEAATRLAPDIPEYAIDLSMVLSRQGRFHEALSSARIALALRPGDATALNNVAQALQSLNRSAEALEHYDAALRIEPGHPMLHLGKATTLLRSGDFRRGWEEFEWRWIVAGGERTDMRMPLWKGEDLSGRRILVHHEQGYGDTLQFIRLVPLLAERGATVTVLVPETLVTLAARVKGVSRSTARIGPGESFDFHCPMLTLPARLHLDPAQAPRPPYLSAEPEEILRQGVPLRRAAWGNGPRPALVVGLVWSGDPRPHDLRASHTDRRRSLAFARLAPLFGVGEVCFVSFQMGAAREQAVESGLPMIDGVKGVTSFADTAARLYGIDLLITVDTSIAHLAGGLGLPVWMLSRADACWRWREHGDTTPWYPTMRIFRQPVSGDWETVVREVSVELRRFAARIREERRKSTAAPVET